MGVGGGEMGGGGGGVKQFCGNNHSLRMRDIVGTVYKRGKFNKCTSRNQKTVSQQCHEILFDVN